MKKTHFFETIEGWSSYDDQGNLLKFILNDFNINEKLKIAEIGVYKGRLTSMWNIELMNMAIDYEYHAIDHFSGSEEHLKNIDYYNICINNLQSILNDNDNIFIIKNDSIKQSYEYDDDFFDIVYIDASHDFESVKNDIIAWLPKVKKNGYICGDDYINGWPDVIKAVDFIFGKDSINLIGRQQWVFKK